MIFFAKSAPQAWLGYIIDHFRHYLEDDDVAELNRLLGLIRSFIAGLHGRPGLATLPAEAQEFVTICHEEALHQALGAAANALAAAASAAPVAVNAAPGITTLAAATVVPAASDAPAAVSTAASPAVVNGSSPEGAIEVEDFSDAESEASSPYVLASPVLSEASISSAPWSIVASVAPSAPPNTEVEEIAAATEAVTGPGNRTILGPSNRPGILVRILY